MDRGEREERERESNIERERGGDKDDTKTNIERERNTEIHRKEDR